MQASTLLHPLGVDFFCFGKKFLVFNLVARNLKVKYRRSFLGFFWTILSPLAMAVVYYFVFKVVLNVQIPHYLVFILSGILPWTFFSQSVLEGMESLVGNLGLLSKIPVPLQVFPFVGTVTNLITLGLALPILIGAALLSGVALGPSLPMILFYFIALFLIAYSFSVVLAVAFVYFRDLRHLMSIIMQLWMYATPVVYQETMVPLKYRWIVYANPLGTTFSGIHAVLVHGAWPDSTELMVTVGWAGFLVFFAAFLQRTLFRDLVEQI